MSDHDNKTASDHSPDTDSTRAGLENTIAIIGMAGRFPGADTVQDLWRNICGGVESIARFTDAQLEDSFAREIRDSPNFVRARPILEGVDLFDAEFFNIYAKEAELMDPQQRLFLECAWQALEDGGYDPAKYADSIGVFAGSSVNSYFLRNVCQSQQTIEAFTNGYQVGNYAMLTGASQDFLATRISYKLNLRGPSITVQSACSTSLLAVAQACQSLLLYQSDMALAGGVSITFPQQRGYLSQEGGMVSSDGHCRTFDAKASGTVFGSGLGVVLLKRAEDALRDGDHIYALIRGCGVNNDGATKVGFTAPSIDGQAAAIEMAMANAGIDARSIGYVECHGTATPLGDPIEIAALTKAFRTHTSDTGFCAVGSVKTNLGHLDVAAGVTGLIKTALVLSNRKIPASLHFEKPNSQIDFENSPFRVNAELRDWHSADPRRAGVSAFGVGGTNVHVVLEESPTSQVKSEAGNPQVLVLSARSELALRQLQHNLSAHLASDEAPLADVAYTLQIGRRHFEYRCAVAAENRDDVIAKLSVGANSKLRIGSPLKGALTTAFMFPGQGAQYLNMARGLYESEPIFRREFDACADLLLPSGRDLRGSIFAESSEVAAKSLTATSLAQPALFTVEFCLAQLWMSWGIVPKFMIGHSVGEFVAAAIAGVMSLEDALSLVAARGEMMQQLPEGAMVAVRANEETVQRLLGETYEVSIAAVNSPTHCVISGPTDSINAFELKLKSSDIAHRRLHTSHAFHSNMVTPMLGAFKNLVHRVRLSAPRRPFVSGVTGKLITDAQATSADYWTQHAREAVRFAAGIRTLADELQVNAFIEVGPGNTLATLARQAIGPSSHSIAIVTSLPTADRQLSDALHLRTALADLWISGIEVDWVGTHSSRPHRVSLPTYPFERRRYWIDITATTSTERSIRVPELQSSVPSSEAEKRAEPASKEELSNTAGIEKSSAASVAEELCALFEELSGERRAENSSDSTFLELGFDSLFLTQVAQRVERQYKLKVTFRQLLGDLNSIPALAGFVADNSAVVANRKAIVPPAVSSAPASAASSNSATVEAVIREQLQAMSQLMERQLLALRGVEAASNQVLSIEKVAPENPEGVAAVPARFKAYAAGARSNQMQSDITPGQKQHIAALIAQYCEKTKGSKQYTQTHRQYLADPRAAAGFRSEWKEMVYPIVAVRAAGSKIWDIDGNEYIDLVNGYGQTAFGHSPQFVVTALQEQLAKGFAIGPQAELAGEVAERIAKLTGNERVAFCNTGSEAVMAAMRVARAVTGRDKVVVFDGAYHGQFDEVLVHSTRGSTGEPRSLPVAVGIPRASVQNMVVLEYDSPVSVQWIRDHADEIAAVIVEPVQSRRPQLIPIEFLKTLRAITAEHEIAFVMDEVVTGFRVHPGGMQTLLDIRADIATYGKVVGGGLPIGIVAGKAKFMDALDGGQWQYGDDSYPEVGVTFFAGTFVRHPLALAATLAVLQHLEIAGATLQEQLAIRTRQLVDALNLEFSNVGLKSIIHVYSSWFYFSVAQESTLASMLFQHLRLRGIHIHDGFPCFMTTAHSDEDLQAIIAAFRDSLQTMRVAGIVGDLDIDDASSAKPSGGPRRLPVTESQLEVWLAAQAGDAASCAFNESLTLRMKGVLNTTALQHALNLLVERHDVLRTTFSVTGEEMNVAVAGSLPLEVVAVASDEPDVEAQLQNLIERDACTAFDLVKGPLIRAQLLQLSSNLNALVLTAHHIVCDGWSINVMLRELAEIYRAHCTSDTATLAEPMQFSDYAVSLRETNDHMAATENYWLQQFATLPAALNLPTDRPRGSAQTYEGGTVSLDLKLELLKKIKAEGAARGSTLFATLLASFQVLLGRLSGQNEVVVGVPFAGQALVETEALIGHAINFLPMRHSWTSESRVSDSLAAVSQQILEAREHQHFTLGTLVQRFGARRDVNRLPVTEVQFNLERLSDHLQLPELDVRVEPNPKLRVIFDLFLNITEFASGLRLDCSYKSSLFDAITIKRWLDCYQAQLESWARDSSQLLLESNYVSAAMRLTLEKASAKREVSVSASSVCELLQNRVTQQSTATAVQCGDASMTYGELWARVESLANYLTTKIVTPPEGQSPRIGIYASRSIEMLIALLAAWKAGCSYVPLDPGNPAARLRHILDDANLAALITDDADHLRELASTGTAAIDLVNDAQQIRSSLPQVIRAPQASDVAYVIYTSGSTGLPKGVEITHGSVVNLLLDMAQRPGLQPSDVLLAVTTISFDISVLELFLPLVVGAKLIIATEEEVIDGNLLKNRIAAAKVSVLQATPATWRLLLEAGFESPKQFKMLCGGEALTRELADRLLSCGGELWNMYGPTETTVWSACARVLKDDAPITVGSAIANTQLYILDANAQLAPFGVLGELYIGGAGVARGYFMRPELNAQKFLANPFAPGKLYRTGDVARYLENGEVQLLGRADQQIKLRGYRIELGEIESALRLLEGVSNAVVSLREDVPGEPRLVGYIVKDPMADPSLADLRKSLATRLPEYMIPTAWVFLSAMPTLANGKLDRAALPGPTQGDKTQVDKIQREHVAPATDLHKKLAKIWSEVLDVEEVGVTDDIFLLGADSIRCFQIVARANREGMPISAKQLMELRTIERVARLLNSSAETEHGDGRPTGAVSAKRTSLREFKRQRLASGHA